MRAAGIRGLVSLAALGGHRYVSLAPYELAESVGRHCKTVPDQGGHLVRIANLLGVSTMPALANALGYDGPLELLSMWACLFGGKQFVGVADKALNANMALECACSPQPRLKRRCIMWWFVCGALGLAACGFLAEVCSVLLYQPKVGLQERTRGGSAPSCALG